MARIIVFIQQGFIQCLEVSYRTRGRNNFVKEETVKFNCWISMITRNTQYLNFRNLKPTRDVLQQAKETPKGSIDIDNTTLKTGFC